MKYFASKLINWYNKNLRDLPWRETQDPYKIWVSEVILQQTRVEQGINYYVRFVKRFPDVKTLANAEEGEVLKLWQGLGYYSRARNMHSTAKKVAAEYNEVFPDDFDRLIALKGIGEYTANAILAFAYNKAVPLVDGNVMRVFARMNGLETDMNSVNGKNEVKKITGVLVDKKSPGIYSQAIMEFGALQCKPHNPNCSICPFSKSCKAFLTSRVDKLPIKINTTKIRTRFFVYLIINSKIKSKKYLFIQKRSKNDIWKGLYEFPVIELSKKISLDKIVTQPAFKDIVLNRKYTVTEVSDWIKHQLSHQLISACFIEIMLDEKIKEKLQPEFLYIRESELGYYAFPVLITNYISQRQKNNQ